MGWLHGYFLVSHFVLFFMVLAILIATFLDSTFLTVPDLSSLLCLLIGDGDPDGDPEGNNPQDIRVRAKGRGYGGLMMPTVLMTLCILSYSTHTESPAGTQILLALPLWLWMG